ncbi:hypothetical protein [Streptomyces wedmorensis]
MRTPSPRPGSTSVKPSSGSNRGFAALNTGGKRHFYNIDVLNGSADLVGAFPAGHPVVDIALPHPLSL